jgi:hypothetical protein
MQVMPARVLTFAAPDLAARFRAAADREPLDALPAGAAAELAALLAEVREFEELPGKWQAALLTAETAPSDSGRAAGMRHSCCG